MVARHNWAKLVGKDLEVHALDHFTDENTTLDEAEASGETARFFSSGKLVRHDKNYIYLLRSGCYDEGTNIEESNQLDVAAVLKSAVVKVKVRK